MTKNNRVTRSRAPLRLGLAGGGTDIEAFYSIHGGRVLNATISMYANCSIAVSQQDQFSALDLKIVEQGNAVNDLILHKEALNYFRELNRDRLDHSRKLNITTWCDAPIGSGVGSSSAIVVAILAALYYSNEILISREELARQAYEIERTRLKLAGGYQDQIAAAYGGLNWIEFQKDKFHVYGIGLREDIFRELESSMLLYYSGASRSSAKVIEDQITNINTDKNQSLKKILFDAEKIKNALVHGDFDEFYNLMMRAWESKKSSSKFVAGPNIKAVENILNKNGAKAFKLSGAGGGGFMTIYVKPEEKVKIVDLLTKLGGKFFPFSFTSGGAECWYAYY
jgi:D-glycero-alpha-D-manno-heptose-7-phosphate kinase